MQPHIRLLYPSAVTDYEVKSAYKAIERFAKFGLEVDQVQVGKGNLRDVLWVRSGREIRDIINAKESVIIDDWALRPGVLEVLLTMRIIGVGITPAPLFRMENGVKEPRIGLSRHLQGALVSISSFMDFEYSTSQKAIELAVAHELGHIFMEKRGHCADEKCLMQENRNCMDFLDRFVKPGLDFCRKCLYDIKTGVSMFTFSLL